MGAQKREEGGMRAHKSRRDARRAGCEKAPRADGEDGEDGGEDASEINLED
ncbi:hypothetical protein EV702DRAFT_1196221 [Suillus placidus]|uniref:Uncharacterized protein n=1 Tax=Suillus placidus TaxID=48579 RepID=A0A9P6ZWX5_9AGAM|nr:hypothetical protein EV702DRAFT_1196221 [Suillus placidus]